VRFWPAVSLNSGAVITAQCFVCLLRRQPHRCRPYCICRSRGPESATRPTESYSLAAVLRFRGEPVFNVIFRQISSRLSPPIAQFSPRSGSSAIPYMINSTSFGDGDTCSSAFADCRDGCFDQYSRCQPFWPLGLGIIGTGCPAATKIFLTTG
jgi:hypothetical protein